MLPMSSVISWKFWYVLNITRKCSKNDDTMLCKKYSCIIKLVIDHLKYRIVVDDNILSVLDMTGRKNHFMICTCETKDEIILHIWYLYVVEIFSESRIQ